VPQSPPARRWEAPTVAPPMAEEELSPAQKLALASNFVVNSPPAQVTNVLDGAHAQHFGSAAA